MSVSATAQRLEAGSAQQKLIGYKCHFSLPGRLLSIGQHLPGRRLSDPHDLQHGLQAVTVCRGMCVGWGEGHPADTDAPSYTCAGNTARADGRGCRA